jgi:hypothetical protein
MTDEAIDPDEQDDVIDDDDEEIDGEPPRESDTVGDGTAVEDELASESDAVSDHDDPVIDADDDDTRKFGGPS